MCQIAGCTATVTLEGQLSELLDDTVDQARRLLRIHLVGPEGRRAHALDALRMLLEAPIDVPIGTDTRRGCLMANSTCELGTADPEVLAHAHRTYEISTALIGDCVARAQREGDLPTDADPIALARALLAAQQGIVFMSRTGSDTATLTATARSLATQLLPDHPGDRTDRR